MNISAVITKVEYKPTMCKQLVEVPYSLLPTALEKYGTFILALNNQNKLAVSWWTGPKRSRTYPLSRVYETLSFTGKRITIIPIYKDEGSDGERDFLQWDTISLMSLLGVYIIIGYYDKAIKNRDYKNKITEQVFNINQIKREIEDLTAFQSDPLHWNLLQANKAGNIGKLAINAYNIISKKTGVVLKSEKYAIKRIEKIGEGAEAFKQLSRLEAHSAQFRELMTKQPKELVNQKDKSTITIKNYLGGLYFLTADEAWIEGENIYLAECKHSDNKNLPNISDIKEGVIKMILFTNLEQVKVDGVEYKPHAVLKLTSRNDLKINRIEDTLTEVRKEAELNNFILEIPSPGSITYKPEEVKKKHRIQEELGI